MTEGVLAGSSGNDEIRTPRWLFDQLNEQFQFDYDPFASHENALTDFYSTADGTYSTGGHMEDPAHGLQYPWMGCRVFMNPPYSRGLVMRCIEKAVSERNNAAIIVALVKADTSTKWFQLLMEHSFIEWLPRRVKYEHPNPPKGWSGASFPSAIALLRKDRW